MDILRIKHCMKSTFLSKELDAEWQIVYSKSAEKFLDKLQDKDKKKILDKIFLLSDENANANLDIKYLINSENEYRLRVGNYRIIYTKHFNVLIIEIIKIADRKDVYK